MINIEVQSVIVLKKSANIDYLEINVRKPTWKRIIDTYTYRKVENRRVRSIRFYSRLLGCGLNEIPSRRIHSGILLTHKGVKDRFRGSKALLTHFHPSIYPLRLLNQIVFTR